MTDQKPVAWREEQMGAGKGWYYSEKPWSDAAQPLYAGPQTPAPAQGSDASDLVLIRKGGYFYRPHACGYTGSVHEAGRFTRSVAASHAANAEGVTVHEISEFARSPAPATTGDGAEAIAQLLKLLSELTPRTSFYRLHGIEHEVKYYQMRFEPEERDKFIAALAHSQSPAECSNPLVTETDVILDAINDRSPRVRLAIDLLLHRYDVRPK